MARTVVLTNKINHVVRVTPGSVETSDDFILTVGASNVNYVAQNPTVADVTLGLFLALSGSVLENINPLTPTDNSTDLEVMHEVLGTSFTMTPSTVDGGGTDDQTLSVVVITDADGAITAGEKTQLETDLGALAFVQSVVVDQANRKITLTCDNANFCSLVTEPKGIIDGILGGVVTDYSVT